MRLTRKQKQEWYDRLSKYWADVSKLVIAGVVLTSITMEDINWWFVGFGLIMAFLTMYGWLRLWG